MSIEDFIITIFCLIDDEFKKMTKGKKLRTRGRRPSLEDSEVITMEVVGEFFGKDSDKGIWEYFKSHWLHFFPGIPDRTNFAKQAANLHAFKRLLQKRLASSIGAFTDQLHLIDGFPMPICKFARAHFSRNFQGRAAYGYCATKKEVYYGFKGHLVVSSEGIITEATYAAANIDERDVCPELVTEITGMLLGDKGLIRSSLGEELSKQKVFLQTSLRENMQESRPKKFVKWVTSKRRLIETVIGQLESRFHIEKVRAKDIWHQASRFWRKLLSHTICASLCIKKGISPLTFDELIAF